MKVIKLINKNKTYKDSKGKERYSSMYMLCFDNRKSIPVKPVFAGDYELLDFVSETKFVEVTKNEKK